MQEWPGNKAAADMILKHLGMFCSAPRASDNEVVFEGKKWGKSFVLTCPISPMQSRTLDIQERNPASQKSLSGVMLGSCSGMDLSKPKEATIFFPTGSVHIDQWGVCVTVK